jgi:hypothetical protein
MRVYYFGCWENYGHYLKDHQGINISYLNNDLPWDQIDGVLCPVDTRKQGVVKIHHKEGWTAAAFWDNSIDSRPMSNSVLFYEDLLGITAIIEEFKKIFPKIYKRFDFKLVEWISPEEKINE